MADKITLLCEASVCLHVCLPLLLSCSSVCKWSIPPSCESCVYGHVAQTDEERQIGCLSCHRSPGSTRLAGRSSVRPYEQRKGHISVRATSFVVRLLIIVNGDATRGCRVTSISKSSRDDNVILIFMYFIFSWSHTAFWSVFSCEWGNNAALHILVEEFGNIRWSKHL